MRLAPFLLLLAACSDPDVCAGEGGPQVDVGALDGGDVVPFRDGDTVAIAGAAGGYYLPLEYDLMGIDPAGDVLVAIRLFWTGETSSDDYLANTLVNCQGEGPMTFSTVAVLQADKQEAAAAGSLDGAEVRIDSAFTDAAGTTIEGSVTVVLSGP